MELKKMLTAIIGLPIVVLVFIFGNEYIVDVLMAIIAIISLREYFKATENEVKPISWIGYLLAACISLIHVVNLQTILIFLCIAIPSLLLILFLHIIISDMKINLKDIALSFFGILFIISFISFIPLIYGLDGGKTIGFTTDGNLESFTTTDLNGKYLIWILMITTWGSDIFAYLIGRYFGKHKFSKVSPNKTIEGCTAGIVGAVVLTLIYTLCINNFVGLDLSYLSLGIIGFILSIIGQIGDFAASTIKRYFNIKDFGNAFPGHGGFIDRIDSVIFTAPFAFCLFLFFL